VRLKQGGGGFKIFLQKTVTKSYVYPFQIAPAEGPDAKLRMVIITGPPEAQFKVQHVKTCQSVAAFGLLRDNIEKKTLNSKHHFIQNCSKCLIFAFLLLKGILYEYKNNTVLSEATFWSPENWWEFHVS